jgi:hypothetical protein
MVGAASTFGLPIIIEVSACLTNEDDIFEDILSPC